MVGSFGATFGALWAGGGLVVVCVCRVGVGWVAGFGLGLVWLPAGWLGAGFWLGRTCVW